MAYTYWNRKAFDDPCVTLLFLDALFGRPYVFLSAQKNTITLTWCFFRNHFHLQSIFIIFYNFLFIFCAPKTGRPNDRWVGLCRLKPWCSASYCTVQVSIPVTLLHCYTWVLVEIPHPCAPHPYKNLYSTVAACPWTHIMSLTPPSTTSKQQLAVVASTPQPF